MKYVLYVGPLTPVLLNPFWDYIIPVLFSEPKAVFGYMKGDSLMQGLKKFE